MGKDVEGKFKVKYYPSIFVKGLEETKKKLNQDSRESRLRFKAGASRSVAT
jgi:hypothetical protein